MKKQFIIAVAMLTFVLVGCAQTPTGQVIANDNSDEVVIGVATILTGDLGSLGINFVDSAQLALETIPHKTAVKLVVENADCARGKGLSAVTKLVETNNAIAIVGGMCSGDTLAAAPFLNSKKIPHLTSATGGKNIDEAGEYVFRIANSDVLAGTMPADDFIKLGYKRVALVTDNADYTLDIRNNFKEQFVKNGGLIVADELVSTDEKDFRTIILKVQSTKPDAIMMLSQFGTTGLVFIKQADQIGVSTPIYTSFTTIVNEKAREIAGDALYGVYFYDASYAETDPAWLAFKSSYEKKFGHESPIPFHTAAMYDSMNVLLEAIDAVGTDGEKIHDYILAHGKTRSGLLGEYGIDEQGNTNVGFTLKQWTKNGAVEVNIN